jgi:hypothetical protein
LEDGQGCFYALRIPEFGHCLCPNIIRDTYRYSAIDKAAVIRLDAARNNIAYYKSR